MLYFEAMIDFISTSRHNDGVTSFGRLRAQGVRKLQYFAIGCGVDPLSNPVAIHILFEC